MSFELVAFVFDFKFGEKSKDVILKKVILMRSRCILFNDTIVKTQLNHKVYENLHLINSILLYCDILK